MMLENIAAEGESQTDAIKHKLKGMWEGVYAVQREWKFPGADWYSVQAKANKLWLELDKVYQQLESLDKQGSSHLELEEAASELQIMLSWYINPEPAPASADISANS
jgi:hypothetical protein